jgi:FtsP/CotA-like multicopper oxidase with cupredoxin domain
MSYNRAFLCAGTSLKGGLFIVGATLFAATPAAAQIGAVVEDPPVLEARPAAPAADPSKGLLTARATDRTLDLDIVYVDGAIPNPGTGRADPVRLRSYAQGGRIPTRFASPTIEARPGDTVRVALNNRLPAKGDCGDEGEGKVNIPHCFNGTNLHTHGLWVNPSGNGDNVLLSINPGVKFEYEYAIPEEHPAGTFWYHTHRHGSTALQVSSGMAGALIIRGDRLPTPQKPGDIDTLLAGARERTIVLQQIQYGCLDAQGNIKVKEDSQGNVIAWVCDPARPGKPADVGGIETYSDANGNGFGPGSWGGSGRYTSINGLILPDFRAKQGVIERWRIIHGGVRDTVALQFRRAKPNATLKAGPKLRAGAMDALIGETCTGDLLPYHLIAADGLTLAAAQRTTVATFQPGYRFDAMVVFPQAGDYCVIDAASEAASSVGGVPSGSRLLGMVRVEAGSPVGEIGSYLAKQLTSVAERVMPADVKPAVIADINSGLRFSRFVPHPDVAAGEIDGTQELTFNIDVNNPARTWFEVGGKDYPPRPYDPGRIDRKLTLGTAEEWNLQSLFVSHPFHIHVNPFQVVEVLDPWGRDVSDPAFPDTYPVDPKTPGAKADTQYAGLKKAWKDTLWVKSALPSNTLPPNTDGTPTNGIYTIKVRTRYQRYIGEFVLHCHILDHEDQGMMQNVAIVLPGGTPASVNAASAGHAH